MYTTTEAPSRSGGFSSLLTAALRYFVLCLLYLSTRPSHDVALYSVTALPLSLELLLDGYSMLVD
jgi:hypothetical protein